MIIQGEVTTSNINANRSITGIQIQNKTKQIKISKYEDDTNLFRKSQESAANVLRIFETLNKATGTTINLEKTIILPVNPNDALKTQNIIRILQLKNNMKQLKF